MKNKTFKEKIKVILKHNKYVYDVLSFMHNFLYYVVKKWMEIISDHKAKYWAEQDLVSIEGYWNSRTDTVKNKFLGDIFNKYTPKSILEIGCNCGNKLYALAKKYPDVRLVGIDINPLAIEKGNEWLKQENLQSVNLMVGRAEELDHFQDRSFDIVFSWAALIYTRPSLIKKVLFDMLRISKKALILLEMQTEKVMRNRKSLGIYCKGNWKRDYVSIIKKITNGIMTIDVAWISPDIWLPGGGGAAVIEAKKNVNKNFDS
ncbi:MAG TPA: class I SAM-dependent methyltransferase [Candidatus Dependentiae bacterium]|nr:class I SAM-dependent methyltransferase [Candidatus Dependentiae bacterium]